MFRAKAAQAIASATLLLLSGCGIGLCTDSGCTGNSVLEFALTDKFLTLAAVEIDDGEITVSWTAPQNGTAPLTYSVYYSAEADSLGTLAGETNATNLKITGLTIDKDYYFSVSVKDAEGRTLDYDPRAPFCGGTGIVGDEFQICDPGSLQYIYNHLSANFTVTRDIDLRDTPNWNTGKGFKSMGLNSGTKFTGILDGGNFAISNLFMNDPQSFYGFIGTMLNATLKNIRLLDVNITGGPFLTGGLVGYTRAASRITNCHVTGRVQAAGQLVGGLVGNTEGSTIVDSSSSTANVSGTRYVGSLAGVNDIGCSVLGSFATGNVIGTTDRIGGLIGHNRGPVTNSYALGSVRGDQAVGGLIGYNEGAVSYSYATGAVTATTSGAGGLVGQGLAGSSVFQSFAVGSVSSPANQGGLVGQPAGTITQSQWFDHPFNPANCYQGGDVGCTSTLNPTSFYSRSTYAAGTFTWDFSSSGSWILPATGKYPVLKWQQPNRPIAFSPEFRNGRKIGPSDVAAYRVWGFCSTPGSTITFGGPNAPVSTTCDGGTWQTSWDFTGSSDGNIDITVQENTSPVVQRRLVKDTTTCTPGLIAETIAGNIDARFLAAYPNGLYHLICNQEQMTRLQAVVTNYSKNFMLANNIDMTGYVPTGIGTLGTNYTGTFDGNGFVLSNLTRDSVATNGIALFGYITGPGEVKNLGVENVYIRGNRAVGGISASSSLPSTTLTNVYSTGYLYAATGLVGGIIGYSRNSVVSSFSTADIVSAADEVGGLIGNPASYGLVMDDSWASGNILGRDQVGGLSGRGRFATANRVRFTGTVSGRNWVGGFMGESEDAGAFADSYSTGTVSCNDQCGGLIGIITSYATVDRCYTSGAIYGHSSVGGLIGETSAFAYIDDSFTTSAVSGWSTNIGALVGTNQQPITASSFLSHPATPTSCAGSNASTVDCTGQTSRSYFYDAQGAPMSTWDFTSTPIWKFPTAGGLPILNGEAEE